MKRDGKDRAWQVWLERARSNLARARMGRQSEDILYEDLCFDAQQAAEKALKGLLLYLHLDYPRTHSIGHLLSVLERRGKVAVPPHIREAVTLTDYAVTTRYPGDWDPVDEEEYREAVRLAEATYKWALQEIERRGASKNPLLGATQPE
ncbi:HEPN domain-containing protein [Moorellaceae bacterium AZ2]